MICSIVTLSMVIDIPAYPNFSLVDSNLDYHSPINLNGFTMNISPGLQVTTPNGMVDFAPRGLNQFPQWSVSINETVGLLSGIISYMNSSNSEQFLLNIVNDVASIHFTQDGGSPCDNNLTAVGCTFNGYFTAVAVPEPSTLPLLATILIALPFFLWRRSHRRSYS